MDKALQRSHREKVLRRLAGLLGDLGYARTKPTFFTRPRGLVVEFVHLHKYTFAPDFRVHLGIRVTNDPREAIALNGPDSEPYVCKGAPGGRRFNFRFHDAAETVERCAAELAAYVATIGEGWFVLWRESSLLLERADSPLSVDAKASLQRAMELGPHLERIARTRRLLGAA
jgi:hypothetical protein